MIEIPEELVGSRVILRPYRADDATALWEAIEESREHLSPWLPWVFAYRSVEDAVAYVARSRARWLLREDLPVGIFGRADGRFLGGTGLHRIRWNIRNFEIGYWIRRTAEGQGFVTEAAQLLTRLAFESLDARRVEIRVDPQNIRSRAIPERLGFVLEGTLRGVGSWPLRPDGVPGDRMIFALVPEDYRGLSWP